MVLEFKEITEVTHHVFGCYYLVQCVHKSSVIYQEVSDEEEVNTFLYTFVAFIKFHST